MTEPAVGDIVKNISEDVKVLIQGEVELAKRELSESAKRGGIGAGMFGAAGYFAINAVTLLYFAAAFGLWALTGWHLAACFLIVAGVLLVIAGVLALLGYLSIKKIKAPEATITEANKTIDGVKTAAQRGLAAVNQPEQPAVGVGPAATPR
ncbi:phage holin family protein [Microlunatus speluncae]|uniref:phage holin family protein n=1 Tax=Microlunatus speluncae TaxID=2594267 RepID=UPI0012668753|nr:phage holin family protein [Microlunatus speluncae]